MEYPESVLTKNKKGKLEVRNLVSRGQFVMYDYHDPKTFKHVENKKKKLYLKGEDGKVEEYYIVPLKDEKRSLFISPEKVEEKFRKVWNGKKRSVENLWK